MHLLFIQVHFLFWQPGRVGVQCTTMEHYTHLAQLARAVEYTNYISAEGWDPYQWVSWYDTKQSDGETLVMLELWGMQSIPLLPLLPGSLCSK